MSLAYVRGMQIDPQTFAERTPVAGPLLRWLTAKGFAFELVEHEATPRAEDGRRVRAQLDGAHSKSLLLTTKQGALILVVAESAARVDLKRVAGAAGLSGRLSFADGAVMAEVLRVQPGSLTPLALINDEARQIASVVVDDALVSAAQVWCHPLVNTASIAMKPGDLVDVIASLHHAPRIASIQKAVS